MLTMELRDSAPLSFSSIHLIDRGRFNPLPSSSSSHRSHSIMDRPPSNWVSVRPPRRDQLVLQFHPVVQVPPMGLYRPNGRLPIRAAQPIAQTLAVVVADPNMQDRENARSDSEDSAISITTTPQGGEIIGFYILKDHLGSGMYGPVRKAMHKVTRSEVAIKFVDKAKLSPYMQGIMRVYREVEIQRRLQHPFMLQMIQVMETPTQMYLVVELCPGGDLFDLLRRRGRLYEHEARRLFCQLAIAVDHCHQLGFVHRDIKAENILIDQFGNLKLADFGFATFNEGEQLLQTHCGSPQYAAPEVFQEEMYRGTAADIWSMGVVLFFMLVGRTPFEGRNFREIQDRVLSSRRVSIPFFVSVECTQLLRMMMKSDPEFRANMRQVINHRWTTHGTVLKNMRTQVATFDYVVNSIPRSASRACLRHFGITDRQIEISSGFLDNLDGMIRLLLREMAVRRLKFVWGAVTYNHPLVPPEPSKTQELTIALLGVDPNEMTREPVVRWDTAPILIDLRSRCDRLGQAFTQARLPDMTFLPGPHTFPFHDFLQEEQHEIEENEREERERQQEMERRAAAAAAAAATTETEDALRSQMDTDDLPERSSELSNFGRNTSQKSAFETNDQPAGSSSSRAEVDRMGSLESKRASVVEATTSVSRLPKRPSLPACLNHEANADHRPLKLSDPPKDREERRKFFEELRQKQKALGRVDSVGTSFNPPPPLPEDDNADGN